jgi:hypothetical protein
MVIEPSTPIGGKDADTSTFTPIGDADTSTSGTPIGDVDTSTSGTPIGDADTSTSGTPIGDADTSTSGTPPSTPITQITETLTESASDVKQKIQRLWNWGTTHPFKFLALMLVLNYTFRNVSKPDTKHLTWDNLISNNTLMNKALKLIGKDPEPSIDIPKGGVKTYMQGMLASVFPGK